jgi:RNA 3'-terminal phosphate cyclase (ATP)
MITIDGSMGEGGGQVLRTSLALAIVTGQPFDLANVRAGRSKPGLLRQHLACVRAAAAISGAEVVGDSLGSTRVIFEPGQARAGDWRFEIGSAGSASLVLQTVLPPLLLAESPSTVTVEGGTHNSAAPPFAFLRDVFAPHVNLDVSLLRWGFYPAGGGAIRAVITPGGRKIERMERGPIRELHAHVAVSGISHRVGHGALGAFRQALGLDKDKLHFHQVPDPRGPGFVAWLEARFDGGAEVFTAFGERRETDGVAQSAIAELRAWEEQDVPVGEHLADQLLLPVALFGGCFRTGPLSQHARTNIQVIDRFLPGRLRVDGDVIRGG